MWKTTQNKTNIGVKLVICIVIIVLSATIFTQIVYADKNKDVKTKAIKPNHINIIARTNGRLKVRVKWSNTKARYYKVYQTTKRHGRYKMVKKTSKTSYVPKNLKLNKTYYYKVRAYNKKHTLTSKVVKIKNKLKYKRSFNVKAYAYHENGWCANGQKCKVGRIATDPNVIPTGTKLYIVGYGFCKACDTGGDIKGRIVDLYMSSESACNSWGVRYPKVYILK